MIRVMGKLVFSTMQEATAFESELENRVATLQASGSLEKNQNEALKPEITLDLHTQKSVDGNYLFNYLKTELANKKFASAHFHIHDCQHVNGGGARPCVIQDFSELKEVIIEK